ncbi:AAA domain-containing protein [Thermoflexibacter ruber]|uniref:Superfamily I DNA and/or RNA helicase n=1 Tax=Thermoflexibacter ruber TaxID=1003 RepID=A0A1I2EA50_9BACT|nr:AAA domain-containing protein [Thermoflexibacter ruber]SFE89563.1 Superfamily I DNA and/or RNA helicase [Thermoflexibacter ruber]
MADILKTYQKRLTNLTHRNKSLLLLSLSQRNFLDLHQLDFLNNKPSFTIIENLIKGMSKTLLCPQVDSRDKFANQVSPILKNIQRTDRFIQEENGAKNLFVGYPIVEGKLLNDTLIRCPLLFFPVEITLENNHWYLKLRENESMSFNKTFLLAYNFFNKIQFSEDFLDQDFEDEQWTKIRKDSRLFRTELYKYLETNNLEVHFNTENFTDSLHYFTKQSKSEFDLFHQTGKLKLQPQAVLGIFPQADSYLAPDYDFLLNTPEDSKFLTRILPFSAPPLNPLLYREGAGGGQGQVYPYPLDASQEKALQAIKNGQSIVVQGPPGTGKSQLICNLIADSIANGKTVLVVCQKKAALDVVYQRLSEKQVQNFAALVHDFQYDRKNIYTQLNQQIEKVHEKAEQKISLEALHYEEKFIQLNRQIEQHIRQLEGFKTALFDTSECGLSVKELYLTSDKNAPHISLTKVEDLGKGFRFDDTYYDFIQKLDLYEKYTEKLEKPDYQWLNRLSFANLEGKDLMKIKQVIKEIEISIPPLSSGEGKGVAQTPLSLSVSSLSPPNHAEIFCKQWKNLSKVIEQLKNPNIFKLFQVCLKYDKNNLTWLNEMEKKMSQMLKKNTLEIHLANSELSFYKKELEKYQQLQSSFFKKLKYVFSKEYKLLKTLAKKNKLKLKGKGTDTLLQKINNRIHFEELRNELIAGESTIDGSLEELESRVLLNDWVLDIPQSLEKEDFKLWFSNYKKGIKLYEQAKKILDTLKVNPNHQNTPSENVNIFDMSSFIKNLLLSDAQTLNTEIKKFAESCLVLFEKYKYWQKYLTKKQITTLWEKPYLAEEWVAVLQEDFELLCEFDQLKASMTEQQLKVIGKLKKIIDENTKNSESNQQALSLGGGLSKILDNSLRIAWIEHIEKQHPILKSVSTPKFGQIEKNLQKAIAEKEKISEQILLVRVHESACKELEYNRLRNLTSYRELKHQVSKKRHVWALRKLIAHFKEEIFKLIPCWLCSPETVSAIFSMDAQLFDLVIFDEASQCFAEKGIPAMYRGKQVVIVGDDKQLAPNDLYQIRWEEDPDSDDNNVALETESLLDLGKQYFPITSLIGHYRSKSLDLIDFSNQYFYNNKLKLLPDYHEFIKGEPSITYLKVEGLWEKNTNLIEAQEVVKIIKQFLEKDKNDIGVITFNYKQQLLIQDLLEEEKIALPPSLFIKNIENVQGDERDIIIFSTTYAPNSRGQLRMQFGSLNLVGGENRMNVAVTRAREKIVVVSSIFPHQLNVEDLTNEGAKVLKKYLEYALEVSQGKYKPTLPTKPKQNLDWFLKEKIKLFVSTQTTTVRSSQTLEISEQIPFADLAIKTLPKLKLILTDDNLYYEALSIKESHVYLPRLFQKKGWDFEQVYSRNWWNNRESILQEFLLL